MMPEVAERADRPRATITSDAGVHGPKMEVPRYADYRKYVDRDVEKKPISTTMGAVRMLSQLVKDKQIGKNIVPIVPDESRTFGMEGMFKQVGIYAHAGQLVVRAHLTFKKRNRPHPHSRGTSDD